MSPLTILLILLRVMLNVIAINIFTTFLQIVNVTNSYWFAFRPIIYTNFLLTNNQLPHQQFVKKNCNSSIFLLLKTIKKKSIALKSKIKYRRKYHLSPYILESRLIYFLHVDLVLVIFTLQSIWSLPLSH